MLSILEEVFRGAYKYSYYRHSYARDRDIILDIDDVRQDVLVSILEEIDYSLLSKKEIDKFRTKTYMVSMCDNFIVDAIRKTEAAKRGVSRERQGEYSLLYIEDLDQETLTCVQNENGIVDDVLEFFRKADPSKYSVDQDTWELFVEYYVLGYTLSEIADRKGFSSHSTVAYRIQSVGKTLFPKIKEEILNLLEVGK